MEILALSRSVHDTLTLHDDLFGPDLWERNIQSVRRIIAGMQEQGQEDENRLPPADAHEAYGFIERFLELSAELRQRSFDASRAFFQVIPAGLFGIKRTLGRPHLIRVRLFRPFSEWLEETYRELEAPDILLQEFERRPGSPGWTWTGPCSAGKSSTACWRSAIRSSR